MVRLGDSQHRLLRHPDQDRGLRLDSGMSVSQVWSFTRQTTNGGPLAVDLTADQWRRRKVASGITSAICTQVLDTADSLAEDMCSSAAFRKSQLDWEAECRSNATWIFRGVAEGIAATLGKNDLSSYQERVEGVCLDELFETYRGVVVSLQKADHEASLVWPLIAQDALRHEVRLLQASLNNALCETFLVLDQQVKDRRLNARERVGTRRRSRGWLATVKDLFRR